MGRLVLLAAFIVALCAACGGVVRDGNTYKQELIFLQDVSTKLAAEQLERAEAAGRAGDTDVCAKLAEDALVAQIRVPYHVEMALFLADLADKPPKVPVVPEARAWCQSKGAP